MTISNETIEIPPEHRLYPARAEAFLRARPVLSAMGNTSLLTAPFSLGICGSRTDERGIDAARAFVEQLAREMPEIVIVSGNAAGTDLAAHYTALKNGIGTIFVLPEGVSHFRIRKQLREVWSWEKVLVVSQFPADACWAVGRAMARNHLILALSRAMLVSAAGSVGGTKAAADAAVRHKVPLFTVGYKESSPVGNVDLHRRRYALPVGKKPGTDHANVDKIVQTIIASGGADSAQNSFALQ